MQSGWSIDTDRDGDWLYLRVAHAQPTGPRADHIETELADALLQVAAGRGHHRMIVEFDNGIALTSLLVGQLVVLHKRVHLNGGMLRLCRLSDFNRDVLRLMGVLDRFPLYADRAAAASL